MLQKPNGRPWSGWQPSFLKKDRPVEQQPTECVICKESKPTITCTVQGYRESGQRTPVLKVEVCKKCLG